MRIVRRSILSPVVMVTAIVMALAVCLAAITGIASAHHGFGGRYDLSRPVWIEGIVVRAYFGQPHAELTLRVPADLAVPPVRIELDSAAGFLDAGSLVVADETRGRTITVELPPTQQYFRLGNRIAVGDTVAIVAVRNCDPPHQFNGQWLRLANGEAVARSAAMSYMVKSC